MRVSSGAKLNADIIQKDKLVEVMSQGKLSLLPNKYGKMCRLYTNNRYSSNNDFMAGVDAALAKSQTTMYVSVLPNGIGQVFGCNTNDDLSSDGWYTTHNYNLCSINDPPA